MSNFTHSWSCDPYILLSWLSIVMIDNIYSHVGRLWWHVIEQFIVWGHEVWEISVSKGVGFEHGNNLRLLHLMIYRDDDREGEEDEWATKMEHAQARVFDWWMIDNGASHGNTLFHQDQQRYRGFRQHHQRHSTVSALAKHTHAWCRQPTWRNGHAFTPSLHARMHAMHHMGAASLAGETRAMGSANPIGETCASQFPHLFLLQHSCMQKLFQKFQEVQEVQCIYFFWKVMGGTTKI